MEFGNDGTKHRISDSILLRIVEETMSLSLWMILIGLLVVAVVCPLRADAQPVAFYVASDGNDGNG